MTGERQRLRRLASALSAIESAHQLSDEWSAYDVADHLEVVLTGLPDHLSTVDAAVADVLACVPLNRLLECASPLAGRSEHARIVFYRAIGIQADPLALSLLLDAVAHDGSDEVALHAAGQLYRHTSRATNSIAELLFAGLPGTRDALLLDALARIGSAEALAVGEVYIELEGREVLREFLNRWRWDAC